MRAARWLGLVGLLAAVVVVFVWFPTRDALASFIHEIQQLGVWGPVLLALIYIPVSLLFLPASLVTLAGGYAFGVWWGTVAVSLGSTAGASAAFWAGRTLLRGWIEERVRSNSRFRAIDQAVAREGFKIVLLTRLSPVFPFNLLNYAFGLTQVRFRDYLLASWIGMLPGTVMYVYLGSAVQNLADLLQGRIEGGAAQKGLFFAGLAATVGVTMVVTRIARRALHEVLPSSPEE